MSSGFPGFDEAFRTFQRGVRHSQQSGREMRWPVHALHVIVLTIPGPVPQIRNVVRRMRDTIRGLDHPDPAIPNGGLEI
jgi:hypothetical protein